VSFTTYQGRKTDQGRGPRTCVLGSSSLVSSLKKDPGDWVVVRYPNLLGWVRANPRFSGPVGRPRTGPYPRRGVLAVLSLPKAPVFGVPDAAVFWEAGGRGN
jgi:hypothetical protein